MPAPFLTQKYADAAGQIMLGRTMAEMASYLDERSEIQGECWIWRGTLNDDGYGRAVIGYIKHGRPVRRYAHRLAFEIALGPVPAGMDLDHLCRNRACINPEHLEPVTRRENVLRGLMPQMLRDRYAAQIHCKRGHPLSGPNLILQGKNKSARTCRECMKQRRRERYRKTGR